MRQLLVFLAPLILLTACQTYSDDDKKGFDKEIQAYLDKEGVDCERSSSGLYYEIIEPGEGELIKYQDKVEFTYKGTLLDGTVFDEQLEEPVEFNVRELIGAWKEIMLELREGGKAFLVAPPQLGYGDRELEDIPANSILVFEMEVIAVK